MPDIAYISIFMDNDLTNITEDFAHFASTRCFPSQIQMLRQIQKEDVQIETFCCIFKCIRINWSSINCNRDIWNYNNYA